ncbi:putative DNA-binding transcriptional regulator AlpA [Paenibacillus sp. V4I3]|uniref:hypothetical protein n=1 Tax=Paenibacillus sp. V4I3 TaxID=3042305 RepID=UPI0027817DEE|nr:hypothetical protein [Paenibacillus sp. V4I3]MDQ0876791.1 putative DNA-binding transcriptional regulator AlpA [Paenibacillus sp. V4I3]
MNIALKIDFQSPKSLSAALRLAADLAERNEKLELQLSELRLNNEYPEVLRISHIMQLCDVSKSKVTEWTNDPNFPILNKQRKKGEVVLVLKMEFYEWLKSR